MKPKRRRSEKLGRVIRTNGVGKDRNRLSRGVVLALRELARQNDTNKETYDLAASIVLALIAISETIDSSVEAWEKRGYWLKADRFRMEWAWAARLGKNMQQALFSGDWSTVASTAAQIAEKLKSVAVPQHHRLGTPWLGAWDKLQQKELTVQQIEQAKGQLKLTGSQASSKNFTS
jgi:hypothetical protein